MKRSCAHILEGRYNFGVVEHPCIFCDIARILEHRWVITCSKRLLSEGCSNSWASFSGLNNWAVTEAIPDEWDWSARPSFNVWRLAIDGRPLVGCAIWELVWVITAVPFGVVEGDFVDTGELFSVKFFE